MIDREIRTREDAMTFVSESLSGIHDFLINVRMINDKDIARTRHYTVYADRLTTAIRHLQSNVTPALAIDSVFL
jgi:hypothetical protein